MFVGHYGVSFAAKNRDQKIPLWLLFVAVQLIDFFWAIFVLMGIERVRIVPGYTAASPLDLYYMPYTHSLVGAALWSIAAGLVSIALYRWNKPAGMIVGLAVFSHWILDVLVHRPDLSLYGGDTKIGLGLWNYKWLEFGLEAAILFAGMYFYMKSTRSATIVGRYGMVVFGVVMLAMQASQFFTPPPASGTTVAISALFAYVFFALIAGWLERKRSFEPQGIAAS